MSDKFEVYNRWVDPKPEITGVILSDFIKYYITTVKLIENSDEESFKPASYGLRLGSRYYINGEYGDLKEGEKLIIPSNSIVFVSMFEKLNIPFYMIARFNLKIDLIYQGIILGTGPQVDPGFTGHLSCPLHNISNNSIKITFKDPFVTIDFIKTTKFASGENVKELEAITDENKLYEHPIKGFEGFNCKLFPVDKKLRQKLDDYIPGGQSVSSSVKYLEDSVLKAQKDIEQAVKDFKDKVDEEASKRRNVERGITVGALALIVALGMWVWQAFQSDYKYIKDLKSTIDQLNGRNMIIQDIDAKIITANEKLENQQKEIKDITLQIVNIKEDKEKPLPLNEKK